MEGSNNRFYAHRPMVSLPSNRNPECCFGVIYCEWYGVYEIVVLSVVEVCADYGGVNVFHVCLNFGVVYGVGVCVNVCGVVCVVVCCLFLTSVLFVVL